MDISQRRLQNVELLMEEQGVTRKQLAADLGKEAGQVNHWWMDPERDGYRGIGKKVARQIEERYGKPRGWLDDLHRAPNIAGEVEGKYELDMRRVPVIGFAIATPTEDGYFDDMGFPPGAGMDYFPWPTKDRGAYALRVRGDSMQPRIRPGQIIIVEPNTPVSALDDVVVRTKDGRKMVKQLLSRRSTEVTLGSINQAHPQRTISLEEVESIHFVAAIVSRNAITEEKP